MLESLALASGAVNQATVAPASTLAFLTNSYCKESSTQNVSGACPAAVLTKGCVTVTTFLPVFDKSKPNSAPTGTKIINSCYFNHPQITWEKLDTSALVPYDKSSKTAAFVNTGCAKACTGTTDSTQCALLFKSENDNGLAPTPQRCVALATCACCAVHPQVKSTFARPRRAFNPPPPTTTTSTPPPIPRLTPCPQLLQHFFHLDDAHVTARLHPCNALLLWMVLDDPVRRLMTLSAS